MVRALATGISFLFHPVFVLTYMLVIQLTINPYMFGIGQGGDADNLILIVFLSSVVIPLVSLVVLKLLGWIQSFRLPSRQERIGPFIITGILYLSLYMHMLRSNAFPQAFVIATLGVIIALFIAFFINNFSKISIHALGMGGLVSMVILMTLYYSYAGFEIAIGATGRYQISTILVVYLSIFIAGLVCTSRLILGAHQVQDIYGGFLVGFFSQLVAFIILQDT